MADSSIPATTTSEGEAKAWKPPHPGGKRLHGLDVLRGVAVLLVIGHHWHQYGDKSYQPLAPLLEAGWIGVDLFFVLSGFLIGGLLIREYRAAGQVDLRRFLVRRALRIYPAFWVLILISTLADRVGIRPFSIVTPDRLLRELLFVQNYGFGLWNHTWSLGVEEHFYLLLSGSFLMLCRLPADRLHHRLTLIFGALFFLIPVLRWHAYQQQEFNWFGLYTYTHLRIDALACGVFLASLTHLAPPSTLTAIRAGRVPLGLLGLALTSACFLGQQSDRLVYTLGLTALYVGFGLIVLCAIDLKSDPRSWRGISLTGLGWVGQRSYSLYLWHMPVLLWLRPTLRHLMPGTPSGPVLMLLYLAVSLFAGALSTRLIEVPVLRLRDRLT